MTYTSITVIMCEDGCDPCTGRTEAPLEAAAGITVAQAKTLAREYADKNNMTACELRMEQRASWYDNVWDWVSAGLGVLFIVVVWSLG